jgi:hypothetical protein
MSLLRPHWGAVVQGPEASRERVERHYGGGGRLVRVRLDNDITCGLQGITESL